MKAHKNDDTQETRIALLEQSICHINETLIRFEKRFDKIDEKFEKIENEIKWVMRFLIGAILVPILIRVFFH